MSSLFSALFVSLLGIASVRAHGYVQDVVVESTHYTGSLPYQDPYMSPFPERIIRPIPSNGDLQCNGYTDGGIIGSKPTSIFTTVAAGEQVHLNWTAWPDSHVGPIVTYLARAPSDITQWVPGNACFKIDEAGKSADGQWAATDGLYATDLIYTITIPPKLQPGQYIIRHEIIALHGAFAYPGVQIYPSCIQIEVTGTGNALPTSGLVSFPGAYTPETPGIFDVYDNPDSTYPIPGPPV
ncbi:glycoside hydrolase family 61 protein [Lenzites betulinus]|nr:glycoside hydrolase family 61 protein [Lenzites betulinus]